MAGEKFQLLRSLFLQEFICQHSYKKSGISANVCHTSYGAGKERRSLGLDSFIASYNVSFRFKGKKKSKKNIQKVVDMDTGRSYKVVIVYTHTPKHILAHITKKKAIKENYHR